MEAILGQTDWRKSSYSGGTGNCVEVGSTSSAVVVRDTTSRKGQLLTFSAETWTAFLGNIK